MGFGFFVAVSSSIPDSSSSSSSSSSVSSSDTSSGFTNFTGEDLLPLISGMGGGFLAVTSDESLSDSSSSDSQSLLSANFGIGLDLSTTASGSSSLSDSSSLSSSEPSLTVFNTFNGEGAGAFATEADCFLVVGFGLLAVCDRLLGPALDVCDTFTASAFFPLSVDLLRGVELFVSSSELSLSEADSLELAVAGGTSVASLGFFTLDYKEHFHGI